MVQELEDRWILGLRDARVTDLAWGSDLVVTLEPEADIRLSLNALLSKGLLGAAGVVPVPLADAADADLHGIEGSKVLSAVAFKNGTLRVVFSSGHHLTLPAEQHGAHARVRSDSDGFRFVRDDATVRMDRTDRAAG
ncbi:DUF6188 family protein [Micromonospora sp. NPDC050397]|uniref:DUF6188 family protein n=1 Tax=Micromonospora sp. NPDC050397 TaxID=3364279 RepID=UPI0038514D4F